MQSIEKSWIRNGSSRGRHNIHATDLYGHRSINEQFDTQDRGGLFASKNDMQVVERTYPFITIAESTVIVANTNSRTDTRNCMKAGARIWRGFKLRLNGPLLPSTLSYSSVKYGKCDKVI
jgi:hypothetical protein